MEILFIILGCWLVADFISGLVHWAEDTYILPYRWYRDNILLPNIDHHRSPGKIVYGSYWNTNRISIILAAVTLMILLLLHITSWPLYLIVLMSSHLNQIHVWSHTNKVHPILSGLRKVGLIQSCRQHGNHHRRPYNNNYCTTTNYLNPMLDYIKFWSRLESILRIEVARGTDKRDGY